MEDNRKKLIKGEHDFKNIVEKGGYLVDKTLLIKEFIDNSDLVLVILLNALHGAIRNVFHMLVFLTAVDSSTRKTI
jgi:hypothetical protein